MSEKKSKKVSKTPQVIDNTNSTFNLSFEKNKEFDFSDDDEKDDQLEMDPSTTEIPKRKISIVLNDAPTLRKSNTSRISTLPPSRTRSSLTAKNDFEKGIDAFELADYNKAVQYFFGYAATTEKKKEIQLCLSYQLACNIIHRITSAPGTIDVYLASILICLPLLPPHRRVILRIAKNIFIKENIQLPENLRIFSGISEEVNSSRQPLNGICCHCKKEVSLIRNQCDCGKERIFDCISFTPAGENPVKCEKCGAIFSQGESCVFCKGTCHPLNL
ncbi:hypothetical protein EDI_185140 [Entamoeba dispar SAW760]|uniref:Uncharacterized protein n=1 Tax=Entamoeba dispar (strain ATCC PRA-260 / SAW760) TaxID=370354 RepID=B0ER76_ENTDS|nr:uncharacterized protein EDI_185140 [Entamoeba dispar SAW760]EDR22978.1 hypothetical protein EDI_185140 [Entamoeba dispar SAW760]|eukprot:EDR22978.1 hypothetical protein EDI_185140 [Entamoeba dispar SAW760]